MKRKHTIPGLLVLSVGVIVGMVIAEGEAHPSSPASAPSRNWSPPPSTRPAPSVTPVPKTIRVGGTARKIVVLR